ncbi:hypothetical protein [Microvirga lotononidis]|uniref:Lipoprotein n=1 Tax=Microvirga lotononidis TaxID=864069 RepID=I4YXB3_9HYPH|nr:hypothetical protein [Microvirga lotononidis]EIM28605.1 hypothetical protein MicloDRAFT_00027430 [Microvirga lotononidis]WQO30400.1 hypothetical protein U0023_29525 [Microvirga lotononidis]
MITKRAFLAAIAPLLAGCSRFEAAEPLPEADRLGVTYKGFDPRRLDREIIDPGQINAIIEFANARLDGWHYPIATMPAGDTHVFLCKGGNIVGYIGATAGVLLRYPTKGGLKFLRNATDEELKQFHDLLI